MFKAQKTAPAAQRYAHLLGLNAQADDDGDDEKDKDMDEEDDKEKDASEDDEDKEKDAEEDDKEKDASEDDDKDKEKDAKASDAESGATAERKRWDTVLSHSSAGGGRIATACNLLATTDLSAKQIIGTLGTVPAASGSGGLYGAMAKVKDPKVGQDGKSVAGQSPGVAAMLAARAKADGKPVK